jgi:hypothetical protein
VALFGRGDQGLKSQTPHSTVERRLASLLDLTRRVKALVFVVGLRYRGSWVTTDLRHCYQVMDCADRGLLDEWMSRWTDLVEFEVVPVVTSAEAAAAVAPRL